MNHFTPFLGLWAWEDDKELKRCIDFSYNHETNKLVLKVINQGECVWDAENLKLKRIVEDGIDVYFFNSNWTSQDGKKMFSMEAEFVESNKEGTFVNVQEITIINENRLKHVLLGYHFEHDKEEWVPFRVETFLNKMPEITK